MSEAIRHALAEQVRWSATSRRLKRGLTRSRLVALALSIAGAVLVTLGAQLGDDAGRIVAAAGAVALAPVAVLRSTVLGRDRVARWIRARSAAEALKAEIHLYLMRAGGYADAHPDPDARLIARTGEIADKVADLAPVVAHDQPAPAAAPPVHDVGDYLAVRVAGQVDGYYLPRARDLSGRLRALRRVEVVLLVASAVLGALAAATGGEDASAWVPVLTTVTTALATHAAAERYEALTVSYFATARRLQALAARWHAGAYGDDAGRLVEDCERAISTENESWLAEWASAAAHEPR